MAAIGGRARAPCSDMFFGHRHNLISRTRAGYEQVGSQNGEGRVRLTIIRMGKLVAYAGRSCTATSRKFS